MPIPSGYGVTVSRLRGTATTNGYGNTEISWANPNKLEIKGCGLAPLAGEELTDRGRHGVEHGWTLYAPYGSDIQPHDRIETPWGTFDVDGPPSPWMSPLSGRQHGMAVALRMVEG